MQQSQQVLEWQKEARAEGRAEGRAEARAEEVRKSLLRALELRFISPVPADLITAVNVLGDINELKRWFDAALIAPSLDAFRAAVSQ